MTWLITLDFLIHIESKNHHMYRWILGYKRSVLAILVCPWVRCESF